MSLHLEVLNREFRRRVDKNERYSMRAYASFLGLHPSALSRVLSGKADLTSSSGVRVAKKLQLSVDEKRRFVRSIVDARNEKELVRVGRLLEAPELRPIAKKVTNELYSQIAKLKSLALLQLTLTRGYSSTPEWIAKALDMSESEARDLLALLTKNGFLDKIDGAYVNTNEHMSAVEDLDTDEIRRKLQTEIADASRSSIDSDKFEDRSHYGMTMAIDPEKLPLARKKIMNFIECLADELECGDRTRVYQLAVSLFPLSPIMEKG